MKYDYFLIFLTIHYNYTCNVQFNKHYMVGKQNKLNERYNRYL